MAVVIKGYSVVSSTRGMVGVYATEAFAKADIAKLSPVMDWGTITVKPVLADVASAECAECGEDVAFIHHAEHACSRLV